MNHSHSYTIYPSVDPDNQVEDHAEEVEPAESGETTNKTRNRATAPVAKKEESPAS